MPTKLVQAPRPPVSPALLRRGSWPPSHFLDARRFDLPDAFTRYVELCREIFERQRFVGQMSRLEAYGVRGRPGRRSGDQRPYAGGPARPVSTTMAFGEGD